MLVKIEGATLKKEGMGKNGKPYKIYELILNGGKYTGFITDPQIGQEIDVEFSEDQYGKHFKILSQKAREDAELKLALTAIVNTLKAMRTDIQEIKTKLNGKLSNTETSAPTSDLPF